MHILEMHYLGEAAHADHASEPEKQLIIQKERGEQRTETEAV